VIAHAYPPRAGLYVERNYDVYLGPWSEAEVAAYLSGRADEAHLYLVSDWVRDRRAEGGVRCLDHRNGEVWLADWTKGEPPQ